MIKIGHVAGQDPLFAYSSVMASDLLKQITRRPSAQRRSWIRGEMNKMNAGGGDAVLVKMDELLGRGWDANQALFDALRLTIANQIASALDRRAQHTAGLGESSSDINAVFCGLIGTIGAGGSIYAGSSGNPEGSAVIGASAANAMVAGGCNARALGEQRGIAEANARIAEANAAAAAAAGMQTGGGDNTALYVVVGGGVAVVALLGAVLLLRKK
jgi:LPXTG-motif cell wall-anchored protein